MKAGDLEVNDLFTHEKYLSTMRRKVNKIPDTEEEDGIEFLILAIRDPDMAWRLPPSTSYFLLPVSQEVTKVL